MNIVSWWSLIKVLGSRPFTVAGTVERGGSTGRGETRFVTKQFRAPGQAHALRLMAIAIFGIAFVTVVVTAGGGEAQAQNGTPPIRVDGKFADWNLTNAVATHADGETDPNRWSYREVAPWSRYCAIDRHASDGNFDFYQFNRTVSGAAASYRAGYDASRHCVVSDAQGKNLNLLHSFERYIWLTRAPGVEQSDRHEITYACSLINTDGDSYVNAMACSRDDITRGCLGSSAASRSCTLGSETWLDIYHCTDTGRDTCSGRQFVRRYETSRIGAYDYFGPGGGQVVGAGESTSAFRTTDPGFTTYRMSTGLPLTRLPDHLVEMSVPVSLLPGFSGGRVCATLAVIGISSTTLEPKFSNPAVDTVPTEQCAVFPSTSPTATARPTATPRPTARPTSTPRPTARPTARPTSTPRPTARPTVRPTSTPRPTARPTARPVAAATSDVNVIRVRLRGATGTERMAIDVNNVWVSIRTVPNEWVIYKTEVDAEIDTLRVRFYNDAVVNGTGRELDVEWAEVNGRRYSSVSRDRYSVGSAVNNVCGRGYRMSATLKCNGYIEFDIGGVASPVPTATPRPTVRPTPRPTATPRPTVRPTPRPTATPLPTVRPAPVTPQTIYRETFTSSGQWTFNRYGSDTATTGRFQVGTPQQTADGNGQVFQPNGDSPRDTGRGALVTGAASGPIYYADDVDFGRTSAHSGLISLPQGSLTMNFDYFFGHGINAGSSDYLRVGIATEGSGSRVSVFRVDAPSLTYGSATWKSTSVDISRFAGQDVRIVVEAADPGTQTFSPGVPAGSNIRSLIEAGVDNITITTR